MNGTAPPKRHPWTLLAGAVLLVPAGCDRPADPTGETGIVVVAGSVATNVTPAATPILVPDPRQPDAGPRIDASEDRDAAQHRLAERSAARRDGNVGQVDPGWQP